MAGDWIKMRSNLWDDPRVSGLADATGAGEAAIIGGLYWLWSTADQHTEDGFLQGLTVKSINRKTGIKGFGEALISIGWLVEADGGMTIPRFEEHNGASAKNRAQTARRVAKCTTKTNAPLTVEALANSENANGESVSSALAREREEKESKPSSASQPSPDPNAPPLASPKQPKGSRLPPDWKLPKPWGEWAMEDRGLSAEQVRTEADKFADYWRAKPGKDAVKLDWLATWRNWVRNAAERIPAGDRSPSGSALFAGVI